MRSAGMLYAHCFSLVKTAGGTRIEENTTLADFPLCRRAIGAAAARRVTPRSSSTQTQSQKPSRVK